MFRWRLDISMLTTWSLTTVSYRFCRIQLLVEPIVEMGKDLKGLVTMSTYSSLSHVLETIHGKNLGRIYCPEVDRLACRSDHLLPFEPE